MFFAGFGNLPVQGRCCRNFESTLTIFCPFLQEEDLWEGLDDPDCLRRRCGSSCTASTYHCTDSPLPRYPDLTGTLGITPLSVCGFWSCNLVRCLPFEKDTVGDMRTFAYLRPYLFRIIHVFWTARRCVDRLVSMVRSGLRWCFSITPCCSLDTHSPLQDVHRENSGEVLPKFCLG